MEAVAQFERIVNDSGFITLQRLTEDDIIGTDEKQGLLEQYLTLSRECGNTDAGHRTRNGRSPYRKQKVKPAHACPTRTTCPERYRPIPVLKSYLPTVATAVCHSPHRWACC